MLGSLMPFPSPEVMSRRRRSNGDSAGSKNVFLISRSCGFCCIRWAASRRAAAAMDALLKRGGEAARARSAGACSTLSSAASCPSTS